MWLVLAPVRMAQVHVLTGPERRRRFSDAEKRAIVAAAFAAGAVVSEVARQADVCPSLIYRWRRELGPGFGGFAEVVLTPTAAAAVGASSGHHGPAGLPISRSGEPARPADAATMGSIEVEVAGSRVRIPASTPADLASAVIAALLRR
jgi:transposase